MKKRFMGITGKLTVGVVLFGLLLGAAASLIGYYEFTSVLEQQYNDAAYEIAETAGRYLNPDKFEEYLATGRTDEEYEEIQRLLDDLVEATNTTLIYVAKVDTSDYRTLTYIYDSVNSSTGWGRYPLGYTEVGVAEQFVNDVRNMVTTGERAREYLYSYSEESGAHTTAGIAIRNSAGEIVAVLGVEKAMTRLEAARGAYVKDVLAGSFIAVVLFLILYNLFLHRQMISPILAVTNEAKRFADSNKPSDTLRSIKRKDEIGVLASAISKMETDIEEYIINLTNVTAERERIGAELNVAAQIQSSMLPNVFPAFPERTEFDIYADLQVASNVSGNFYDFFLVDQNHLAVVIGDIHGSGVPATLLMVITQTLLKNFSKLGFEPAKVFAETNNQLSESNEGMTPTAFLGILNLTSGEFTYVNAGHEVPLLKHAGGEFTPLPAKDCFVLGSMAGVPYWQQSVQLAQGDLLFLYTKGLIEAENREQVQYSLDHMHMRLNQALGEAYELQEICGIMKQDVEEFLGEEPRQQDITMLMLRYFGI